MPLSINPNSRPKSNCLESRGRPIAREQSLHQVVGVVDHPVRPGACRHLTTAGGSSPAIGGYNPRIDGGRPRHRCRSLGARRGCGHCPDLPRRLRLQRAVELTTSGRPQPDGRTCFSALFDTVSRAIRLLPCKIAAATSPIWVDMVPQHRPMRGRG